VIWGSFCKTKCPEKTVNSPCENCLTFDFRFLTTWHWGWKRLSSTMYVVLYWDSFMGLRLKYTFLLPWWYFEEETEGGSLPYNSCRKLRLLISYLVVPGCFFRFFFFVAACAVILCKQAEGFPQVTRLCSYCLMSQLSVTEIPPPAPAPPPGSSYASLGVFLFALINRH